MSYTWEELAESQDFNHGDRFIELGKYDDLVERVKLAEKCMRNAWSIPTSCGAGLPQTELYPYRNKYPEVLK